MAWRWPGAWVRIAAQLTQDAVVGKGHVRAAKLDSTGRPSNTDFFYWEWALYGTYDPAVVPTL